MSCSVRCLDAAPTKSCGIGPKPSRGTIPSPENWITRSIDVAWLVSFIAFFIFWGVGSLFLIPFFFDFYRGIQGVRVSTNCTVAHPPMSLPSTCPTQLGRAVLGSKLFVLIFVCQILGSMWRISLCVTFTSGSLIPLMAECATTVSV